MNVYALKISLKYSSFVRYIICEYPKMGTIISSDFKHGKFRLLDEEYFLKKVNENHVVVNCKNFASR